MNLVLRTLGLWMSVGCSVFAQFAPNDYVRLRRDEPLVAQNGLSQRGKIGEPFEVRGFDPKLQRVYLTTVGGDGKAAVVSVPREAVDAFEYSDWLQSGAEAFRRLDLLAAQKFFVRAATADRTQKTALDLIEQTRALGANAAALQKARKARFDSGAEFDRQMRNAKVADRPNPLFRDSSNQQRAADLRTKAEAFMKRLDEDVAAAERGLRGTLEAMVRTRTELIDSGALSVATGIDDSLRTVAGRFFKDESETLPLKQIEREEVQRRIDAANRVLAEARKSLQENKLSAAREQAQRGLAAEPGRGDLMKIRDEVQARSDKVNALLALALPLIEQKRLEEALAEVSKGEAICKDHDRLNDLGRTLRDRLREKEALLAKARVLEKAGDFMGALEIFDKYGLEADAKRTTALAGGSAEKAKNYLLAFEFYGRAGAGADLERVAPLRAEQMKDYQEAETCFAEKRDAEALAIYARYSDDVARRGVLLRQAARAERTGAFDEALRLYNDASAFDERAQLKAFVEKRSEWIGSAKELERTNKDEDLVRALDLFTNADARDDLRRVAITLAKRAEKKPDLAADYFDLAGEYAEAQRLRSKPATTPPNQRLVAKDVFRKCAPACVTIIVPGVPGAGGTGFFIAKGGYVLTSGHVVGKAKSVEIETNSRHRFPAEVIVVRETPDVAILCATIEQDSPFRQHPRLRTGDSGNVPAGANVYALGAPENLPQNITSGIVSKSAREFRKNNCLQVSVPINLGNCGGPLIDEKGNVVGINCYGRGTVPSSHVGAGAGDADSRDVNYAVMISEALPLLTQFGIARE